MLHITELHFNQEVYDQVKEQNLLNKKWFVIDSFTNKLLGAFDTFDEAFKANILE